MSGKWMFRALLAAGALAAGWLSAEAAPPWNNLISLNGVDADPQKAYSLSENNGPWLVMACTFSGNGAEKQADDLVHELRKRYKLPAYVYRVELDPGEAAGRGNVDPYGNAKKWNYLKYKDSKDRKQARHPDLAEVAVLVGNYQSLDDPTAQETLRTVKFAKPRCLEVTGDQATHQTLTGWRLIQKELYERWGSEKRKLGPMGHAFITRNPLLPEEYFVTKGIDAEVVALNKGVPFDLLDCPGKFTVQVATFKGKVVIRQEEIRAIEEGREEIGSELAAAAKKADDLTHLLRYKGYEAYQFHDRYASIVTVGSFDSVGTPRSDGKIEINPRIFRTIQVFGPDAARSQELKDRLAAQGLDKKMIPAAIRTINGIPFDPQPIPVIVPRRPFSATPSADE